MFEEKFIYTVVFMSFLLMALFPNLRYFIRDKEDYFSDYRNSIDISYEDFKMRYWIGRVLWAVLAILLTCGLVWSLV